MKTKPDSWMPFFVADYLGDTMHLGTLQHGAYLLLIFHYWRAGCLPPDDHQLAQIVKLSYRDWLGMKPTIQAFFHDGWKHKRVDRELEKARGKYAKRVGSSEAAAVVREAKKQEASPSPISPEKRVRDLTPAEADLCQAANGVRWLKGRDVDVEKWRQRVDDRQKRRNAQPEERKSA